MGKARGVAKRRRKAKTQRYTRSKKLKQVRRRELRKGGSIGNDVVRVAWNHKKSLKDNLTSMGLAHDPNKLLSGPRLVDQWRKPDDSCRTNMVLQLHEKLKLKRQRNQLKRLKKAPKSDFKVEKMNVDNDDDDNVEEEKVVDEQNSDLSIKPETVADKLATMALQPAPKNFRFGMENIKYCTYMIEKYGDDYESMSRDKMNHYQESPGQIRAKIKKFLLIESHRRVYEMAKSSFDENNMA